MAHSVDIIAEIGVAHCGNVDVALRLSQEAIEAGADIIKLQRFEAHPVLRERLADFRLTGEELAKVQMLVNSAGRGFACSAFSPGDAEWLGCRGCDFIKIPSGRIFNRKLIDAVNATGTSAWVSTGMMRSASYNWVREVTTLDGVFLCRSLYPTMLEDACLGGISGLAWAFDYKVPIGYSCHCPRVEVPIAAAALGADMIEVHYGKQGPDAAVSFGENDLRHICRMREQMSDTDDGLYEPTMEEVNHLISIIEDDKCVS